MKLIKYISIITICLLQQIMSIGQNIPLDNSTAPSGTSILPVFPIAYNQGGNVAPSTFNFTRTWQPLVPITDTTGFNLYTGYSLGASSVKVGTLYTNGWGSSLLSIQHRTDNLHDIATPYDTRTSSTQLSFLSFPTDYANSHFLNDPYATQKTYYQNLYPLEDGVAYKETKKLFSNGIESNSLFIAGKSFAGQNRGITTQTTFNNSSDAIRIWSINAAGQPFTNGIYNPNVLTKTVSIGQHDQQTILFKDRTNQTVCKKNYAGNNVWLTTYFVYDDFGRLCFVLTPKAVKAIETNGWSVSSSVLTGLCFSYVYDRNGRVIQKTVPDKNGSDYIIYDRFSRAVLTQNPLMQQQSKWQFTIFDEQDRPVFSGITTSSNTPSGWQNQINAGTATPGSLLDFLINGFKGIYPATNTSLPSSEIWEYYYYDTYDQDPLLTGRSFDYGNANEYLQGSFYLQPQPSNNTYGKLTGKRTYIPNATGINPWINSVVFYDKFGNVIQTQTQNPFNNFGQWDIVTNQFSFNGEICLSINDHHSWLGTTKPDTRLIKKYEYDFAFGRIKEIKQKTDYDPTWHSIATFSYDALGRVTEKRLGGVEHQVFNYNIRGQITDLNKDFVNYPNTSSTQDMTFGMTLGYDYGFTNPRYDGQISGFIWRGSGNHSAKRAYGYSYDAGMKLTAADFREYTITNNSPLVNVWNKDQTDYSVSKLTYDENGNLLTMKQRGVDVSGTSMPVDIDDLTYSYLPNSNALDKIEDAVSVNYHLEDFVNNNQNTSDYSYDANGNLIGDANKGIINIAYNYFNQPVTTNSSAGTISNLYDATGTLLQKTIVPSSGPTQVYRYWGGFTYRNDSLLYVRHEEGRTRWLADSSKFKYDFFIKDHLGNVRTTVTADEGGTKEFVATYEIAAANTENLIFEGIEGHRAPKPGSTNSSDVQAALLNGAEPDKRIGTSLLIKVMAGDKFNTSAFHFYDSDGDDNVSASSDDMLGSILSTLTNSNSPVGGEGSSSTIVNKLFTPANYSDIYDGIKEQATNPDLPRAYLNYIVFDENMRIVPDQSGALQVNSTVGSWQQISLPTEITVGQNGYLAVYISNEQHKNVYFDYLSISHYRGRLLEENHYYPYGLTIRAGSNTPLPNKQLYQGKNFQDECGLNLYDFSARHYDPQIGRFCGVDPADQFASGYIGMGNDPANNIDPSGMQASLPGGGASTSVNVDASRSPKDEQPWKTNLDNWEDYLPAGWERPSSGSLDVMVVYASEMSYNLEAKVKTSAKWYGSKGFGLWIESFDHDLGFGYYKPEKDEADENGIKTRYAIGFGRMGPVSKWQSLAPSSKRFDFPEFGHPRVYDAPFGTCDYEWLFIPMPPVLKVFGIGVKGARALELGAVAEEKSLAIAERGLWTGAETEGVAITRGFTTLSQTRAGQNLIKLTQGMPWYQGSQAYNMWKRLSAAFVMGIPEGSTVHVFVTEAALKNSESIFNAVEKPILEARGIPYVINMIK